MAWSFGDGWDLYATSTDFAAGTGYWDSVVGLVGNIGIGTGRFANTRSVLFSAGTALVKSSGQNDAVHHLVIAINQTAAISGTTQGQYLQLLDGTTAQCSIVFRSDGAIQLVSGIPTGTVLATYTNAFPVSNTWYGFEFEVVINNTTGSFRVRRNGNVADDFTATSLDTQNSANAYANKLQYGSQGNIIQQLADDLFWRSDVSSVAWLGELRCYTRMPASDASVQFAPAGSRTITTAGAGGAGITASTSCYTLIVATTAGTLTAVTINFAGSPTYTGSVKCALFNDAAGLPGTVLATATNIITNPPNGLLTPFVFSGVTVTVGQRFWIGICPDTTATFFILSNGNAMWRSTAPVYASFPATPSGFTTAGTIGSTVTIAPINSSCVNEAQQDGLTTYVYDSTVGHADLYGVSPVAISSGAIVALTTRGFMQKSEVGTRSAAMQTKSGGTTVASPTVVLSNIQWQWAWRIDLTDPATGATWTPTNANAVQIGPTVIA